MSKYGDWRVCMRKTLVLGLGPVSSVSLSGSAMLGLVSGSEGSSRMSAICLALAMYLWSWSGRKLHSLKKWPLLGRPACLQSGHDLAGRLGRALAFYGALAPISLR